MIYKFAHRGREAHLEITHRVCGWSKKYPGLIQSTFQPDLCAWILRFPAACHSSPCLPPLSSVDNRVAWAQAQPGMAIPGSGEG